MRAPRLGDHVAVRRHVVGGARKVILHDTSDDGLGSAEIGEREWLVLQHADGTRDLAGVLAAASADGAVVSDGQLRHFFDSLEAAGLMGEGPPPAPAAPAPETGERSARPLEQLAGFSLSCDGGGTCCRFYPTTSFSPLEVARARVSLPLVLDGGIDPRRAFTPDRGPSMLAWRAAAVAMVDGRCAFLTERQRCGLHEAAGAGSKPLGCRLYPARFVDDGAVVRVTPWIECACVLSSAAERRPGAAPLLDPAARTVADLDPAVHVERLSDARTGTEPGSAARLGAQLEVELEAKLGEHGDGDVDTPLLWLLLAEQPADIGSAVALSRRAPSSAGGSASRMGALRHELARLARGVDRHLAREGSWRHAQDLALTAPRWMQAAMAEMGEGVGPDDADLADERFMLRAMVFGRQWLVDDGRPASASLVARAARALVARAMRRVPGDGVPSSVAAHPLALVEAAARAFAL